MKNFRERVKKLFGRYGFLISAFAVFVLGMRISYIGSIVDNGAGCFAVSVTRYGTFASYGDDVYLYFFNEQNELIKEVKYSVRGAIDVSGNTKAVTVSTGNRTEHFDYSGNRLSEDMGGTVTRVVMDLSKLYPVRKEMTLTGYEYLVVNHNGTEQEIHLDKKLYIGKIVSAIFSLSIVIFMAVVFKAIYRKENKNE